MRVDDLPAGVYLVRVSDEKQSSCLHLLIAR
jgi:hypothetical protein